MQRQTFSSGTPWEPIVGYSRAVRVGSNIFVSGTVAAGPDGGLIGLDDPAAQTSQAIRNIIRALESFGANVTNVVRTRIYVANIDHWQAIGKAHAEFFGHVRPATTMIEVRRLITPDALVEIEADAILP
jgi:enamine deaminase RidA (YjgF/YER057c/UK114 family)